MISEPYSENNNDGSEFIKLNFSVTFTSINKLIWVLIYDIKVNGDTFSNVDFSFFKYDSSIVIVSDSFLILTFWYKSIIASLIWSNV